MIYTTKLRVAILTVIPLLLMMTGFAMAQPVDAGDAGNSFLMGFREPLLEVAGLVIAAGLAWLANILRTKFNLEIEAKHRNALQTALENAAATVIDSALKGEKPKKADMQALGVEVGSTALNTGIDYVKRSVPDAIKKFGLDDFMIDKLLRPHIIKLGAKILTGK